MDLSILHNEFYTDPLSLGYAAFIQVGDDQALANLLNAPGSGTVNATIVPRDAFMMGIIPAIVAISSLDAPTQAMWDRILGVIQAADSVDLTSAAVQGLLSNAVAQNLLTSEQSTALTTRMGSRAEVLYGAGTIINSFECSQAR